MSQNPHRHSYQKPKIRLTNRRYPSIFRTDMTNDPVQDRLSPREAHLLALFISLRFDVFALARQEHLAPSELFAFIQSPTIQAHLAAIKDRADHALSIRAAQARAVALDVLARVAKSTPEPIESAPPRRATREPDFTTPPRSPQKLDISRDTNTPERASALQTPEQRSCTCLSVTRCTSASPLPSSSPRPSRASPPSPPVPQEPISPAASISPSPCPALWKTPSSATPSRPRKRRCGSRSRPRTGTSSRVHSPINLWASARPASRASPRSWRKCGRASSTATPSPTGTPSSSPTPPVSSCTGSIATRCPPTARRTRAPTTAPPPGPSAAESGSPTPTRRPCLKMR